MRIFFILLFVVCQNYLQAQTAGQKLSVINQVFPSEKIYVHTDRTFYSANDELYFKVYITNGETQKPTGTSNTVSINLIDARGNIMEAKQQPLDKGRTSGCFQLRNLPGGRYKIKAFTNWTGNLGTGYIFEKEITIRKAIYANLLLKMETGLKSYLPGQRVEAWVKASDLDNKPIALQPVKYEVMYQSKPIHTGSAATNADGKAIFAFDIPEYVKENDLVLTAYLEYEGKKESVFRPVVLNLDEVSLTFLPEGGQLVEGLPSTVAFRALRSNGKPAEVSGTVQDETGKIITAFKSLKFGMGRLNFTPQPGHTYTAHVETATGKMRPFSLPVALREGVVMQLKNSKEGSHELFIYSSVPQQVSLFLYAHGKIYAERVVELKANQENLVALSTDSISPGIAKITLFKGPQPVCERLIFVNAEKTLNINLKTDKEKYSPFEKVELEITVKDHLDQPVEGNFSLAVVDDKNLTMADDKQDNILSALLMSSELQGTIEEPGIYFRKEEPQAAELLDLVMLTHGWRRYNWNEVLALKEEDWKQKIKFLPDAFGYTGNVMLDGYEPVKGGIQVTLLKPDKLTVLADSTGKFFLPVAHLDFPAHLRFRKNGYSEKKWVREDELWRNNNGVIYNPFAAKTNSMASTSISEQKELLKKEVSLVTAEKKTESILTTGGSLEEVVVGDEQELSSVEIRSYSVPLISTDAAACMRIDRSVAAIPHYSYYYDPFTTNYDYTVHGRNYYPGTRFNLRYIGYIVRNLNNKEFYSPEYSSYVQEPYKQNDDRTTLYWNHDITTDKKGKAKLSFYTCKNVSAYTAMLEGMSDEGQVGKGTSAFYVQKPLTIQTKLPVVVTRGDRFIARCVLTNHTPHIIEASLQVSENKDFRLDGSKEMTCKIPADSFIVKDIAVEVLPFPALVNEANLYTGNRFSIKISAEGLADEASQKITVNKAGFDYSASVSGTEKEKTFSFEITDPVNTDFTAKIEVLTNTFRDLDNALQGMIREPHGCFEQVSATNYPNILALQYLKKRGLADPEFTQKALQHLNSGYQQLAHYETADHGFEWYGHTPPHEALTAFGLMQFHEMKKLGIEVDETMIKRTIAWLMGRRTGSGVFMQNTGKYGFSSAPRSTASAYITYALSYIGEKNLDNEIKAIEADLRQKFDFYKMVLLANTCFKVGKQAKANDLVEQLVKHVRKNGIDKIETGPSFVYCYNPVIECISLLTLAITENQLQQYRPEVVEYLSYIYGQRSQYGSYGNTQQTVMAISAIMAANDFLNNDTESKTGEMVVDINGHRLPVYNISSVADVRDLSLGQYLVKGKNTVRLLCSTENEKAPLYTFGASWKELVPEAVKNNKVDIATSMPKNEYNEGETARIDVVLKNTTNDGLPQTVAIIGTPAGMSFDSQELKRLMEEKLFDYYELQDNYLVLYYAEMAPAAVIHIPLNLKSDIPGTFVTPPACAYLYYNSQYKSWSKTASVNIR